MADYISDTSKKLEKALRESLELDKETLRVKAQFWDCLTPDEKVVLYRVAMEHFHGED